MNSVTTAPTSIPFLRSTEEQVFKVRRQLEGLSSDLRLLQDILGVCAAARSADAGNVDNVNHVLRRCGGERLVSAQKTLASILERFGGATDAPADRGSVE